MGPAAARHPIPVNAQRLLLSVQLALRVVLGVPDECELLLLGRVEVAVLADRLALDTDGLGGPAPLVRLRVRRWRPYVFLADRDASLRPLAHVLLRARIYHLFGRVLAGLDRSFLRRSGELVPDFEEEQLLHSFCEGDHAISGRLIEPGVFCQEFLQL